MASKWRIIEYSDEYQLEHCGRYEYVYINKTTKKHIPYCHKCKAICPDEIIIQGKLLGAYVYDEPGYGVFKMDTEKWI